jgi:uncharacterized protein (DUF2252 family)
MQESAFAYLRGTAPLYYELLGACPELAAGPEGEGWIVGDLHLENFGAFRTGSSDDEVVFDLNDFDDTVEAPWRWDVLRLLTSLLLATRGRGMSGSFAIELARKLVHAYAEHLASGKMPHTPEPVAKLTERVADRKREQFLNSRTRISGGRRHFVLGEKYAQLPDSVVKSVAHSLKTFLPAAGEERPEPEKLELIDAAFRVAGTGSLGCHRIAALTEGKGSPDACWIFDIKEEFQAAAELAGIKSTLAPNDRVVQGLRRCVARGPRMLGTTTLNGRPMILRRFMPQEDKLEASALEQAEFESIVPFFGALTARGHLRGAEKRPARVWSEQDCEDMVARATVVAGWHEAVYLAFSRTLS